MKPSTIIISLLASVYSVTAAAPSNPAREIADGFYQVTVDDSGNSKTKFTPWAKVGQASVRPRSILEKRREHCGPGSVSVGDSDAANKCLIDSFPAGDNVYLNKNSWSYCVRGDVVSYVCPYSNGYKPRASIQGTWSYVKGRCGASILGYAQVSNGIGDWTAGYALKTDHFCTKDFKIGT